jgi:predicted transcriptional regulator
MKKRATFTVDNIILDRLDKLTKSTGVNKSKMVEEALKDLVGLQSLVKKWKGDI